MLVIKAACNGEETGPGIYHPIEREDIIALGDAIDNVTDTIEDVLLRFYMFNITEMHEDAIKMLLLLCSVVRR